MSEPSTEQIAQMAEALTNLVVLVTNYKAQLMASGFPDHVADELVVQLHAQVVSGVGRG